MKKEYLDKLYSERASIQAEIEKLVEETKAPRNADCQGCGCPISAKLKARRDHLGCINHFITEYLNVHSK